MRLGEDTLALPPRSFVCVAAGSRPHLQRSERGAGAVPQLQHPLRVGGLHARPRTGGDVRPPHAAGDRPDRIAIRLPRRGGLSPHGAGRGGGGLRGVVERRRNRTYPANGALPLAQLGEGRGVSRNTRGGGPAQTKAAPHSTRPRASARYRVTRCAEAWGRGGSPGGRGRSRAWRGRDPALAHPDALPIASGGAIRDGRASAYGNSWARTPDGGADDRPAFGPGIDRREFLRYGAGGAAALLTWRFLGAGRGQERRPGRRARPRARSRST